ncbi:hypothetical protein [Sporosarcina sp. P13]|uniref:hypothetical protein n=1 Tax=Sporosarcina sp. P13 TaxID=2048263 RepID=UPI00117A8887|nr:hypothetical protein [Sporosarcina sp. P13]
MKRATIITGSKYTIAGQLITGTALISVENGNTANLNYHSELAAGHKFGKESTLNHKLSDVFKDVKLPNPTKFGDCGSMTKLANIIASTCNEESVNCMDQLIKKMVNKKSKLQGLMELGVELYSIGDVSAALVCKDSAVTVTEDGKPVAD